ncbi:hypothetical protein [Streptomyces sp. V4I2]|uniref:hypothetical protein n=1 Tax=Streptomyces sp. V4I2 TaxID=3042280 RepID=UPI0035941641
MFAGAGAHVLGVGRRPDVLAESAAQHPSYIPERRVALTRRDCADARSLPGPRASRARSAR